MPYSKGFQSLQSKTLANKAMEDIATGQKEWAKRLIEATAPMSIRERKAYIAGVMDFISLNSRLRHTISSTESDDEFLATLTIGIYAGAMKIVLKHYGMKHQ
jgi:hypothetical protein